MTRTVNWLIGLIIGLSISFSSCISFAFTLFMQQDFGIRNNQRLCKYSDGNVYAFNATDLCSLSIDGSAPGMGKGMGFYKGDYQEGMTKVCVYDVLGEKKALRVNSYEVCPVTHNF